MQKKKIKIAVVDSGIDTTAADLAKYVVISTGFEVDNEGYIVENSQKEIKNRHGTVISLIIKHLCKNVELISVNILNEQLATDGRVLIYALGQVLNLQPDIIHLSLGTTKQKYQIRLRNIVGKAQKKNIILVAASHNDPQLITYPAYLKGVVGVKADLFNNCLQYYCKDDFFYAPLAAKSIPGVEEWEAGYATGTSIAAAYVTGHIANIMDKENERDTAAVRQILVANAVQQP